MLEQSWLFWLVQNSLGATLRPETAGPHSDEMPERAKIVRGGDRPFPGISTAFSGPFGSRRDKPEHHLLHAENGVRTAQCDRAGLLFGSYPDGSRTPDQCERIVAD